MDRSKVEGEALSGLRSAMSKWVEILEGPSASRKERTPWRYNERSAVSSFAGAIWRSDDGFAIEEFDYHKLDTSTGFGRCDLWCRLGGNQYAMEFKYSRLYLRRQGEFSSIVRNALDDAEADARRMSTYDDDRSLVAGVFVIPVIDMSRDANEWLNIFDSSDELLESTTRALSHPGTLRAWHFLPEEDLRDFVDARNPDLLHLGAALLLSEVDAV